MKPAAAPKHATATVAGSYLLLIVVAAFVGLTYGPELEGHLAPVITEHAVGVKDLGQNFQFTLEGRKNRSCLLVTSSVGWRVDHSVVPTALLDQLGTAVPIPQGIGYHEHFTLGPYWVSIPDAARTYKNAALKITYYYRCSFLWLTEQDLTIPLKDAG